MNDIYLDISDIINTYIKFKIKIFSAYTVYRDLNKKYDIESVRKMLDQMSGSTNSRLIKIKAVHNPDDETEKRIFAKDEWIPNYINFSFDSPTGVSPDMIENLYIIR